MKIVVEKYKQTDLPAMLAIWNEVVEAGQAFPQEYPETLESAKTFFESQTCCGVAKNAETGEILGMYILHPNNIGRCSHICNASYAVSSNAKGCGAGEALVRHSLAIGAKSGFRIMQFNAVTSDNVAANALYEKLGFQHLGSIPGGFRRDCGEYVPINLYFRPLI